MWTCEWKLYRFSNGKKLFEGKIQNSMCWTVAGVHGGSEPGQSSSTRSNKDRVHKEEVGKPDAGHLPPLPTRRTSQGTKNRRQARQVGGGVECVCGQEEVSGCLDGCIGGGAAGKSEEPQCTCITTTWPPLPPLPTPPPSFCVRCSYEYNENTEWSLCTILSFSSVASLRKFHSGYFD